MRGANDRLKLIFAMTDYHGSARFRDQHRLIALCVLLPAAESTAVWALGVPDALGLVPQVSAPAPFGVFHDLRWLLVYNRSWWTFAVGLLVLIGFRTVVTALSVHWAWPLSNDVTARPDFKTTLRHAALFTLLTLVLMAPWALLLFGMEVVSLSWLFFTAVPTALVIALLVHHGVARHGEWRRAPRLRTLAWTLATFFVLMVDAAVLMACPAALRPAFAAGAGVFNAWVWFVVVRTTAGEPATKKLRPAVPLGLAAMIVVVVGGAAIGFDTVAGKAAHHNGSASQVNPAGRPVIVVTGFESQWDGQPGSDLGGGYNETRFSYRGEDASGRPLAYSGRDTQQPLDKLEGLLAGQVAHLHQTTGRPVALVAESEGALIAKTYLLDYPHPPVDLLVMLSPLSHPGRAVYPPRGQAGWGQVTAYGLRALTASIDAVSPFELSPETPFLQSLVARGPSLDRVVSCPVAGVEQAAIYPMADSVVGPNLHPASVDLIVVPAFHGGLLGDKGVRVQVRTLLAGNRPARNAFLRRAESIMSAASSAWRVPGLTSALRKLPANPCGATTPSVSQP